MGRTPSGHSGGGAGTSRIRLGMVCDGSLVPVVPGGTAARFASWTSSGRSRDHGSRRPPYPPPAASPPSRRPPPLLPRRPGPRLLVEVDGSPSSHGALVWALREAARREGLVVAV